MNPALITENVFARAEKRLTDKQAAKKPLCLNCSNAIVTGLLGGVMPSVSCRRGHWSQEIPYFAVIDGRRDEVAAAKSCPDFESSRDEKVPLRARK